MNKSRKISIRKNLGCIIFCIFTIYTAPVLSSDTGISDTSPDVEAPYYSSIDFLQFPAYTKTGSKKLTAGVFLIANRNLHDPNFSQTVILITQYNEQGTVGLIINRPLKLPVIEAFPKLGNINKHLGMIHLGGPVAINNVQLLVWSDIKLDQSLHIFGGIYLLHDAAALGQLILPDDKRPKIKFYAGYAGWAAGQLESELLRGDWYIWQADENRLFTSTPESIWSELIDMATSQWVEFESGSQQISTYNRVEGIGRNP